MFPAPPADGSQPVSSVRARPFLERGTSVFAVVGFLRKYQVDAAARDTTERWAQDLVAGAEKTFEIHGKVSGTYNYGRPQCCEYLGLSY